MDRQRQKLEIMFSFARRFCYLSMCKRSLQACIIFPKDCSRVLAIGYNGPARGIDHDSCTGEPFHCGCVHAETNALIKLTDYSPSIMFSMMTPCKLCAAAIINANCITDYWYDSEYRILDGKHLLEKGGITTHVTIYKRGELSSEPG